MTRRMLCVCITLTACDIDFLGPERIAQFAAFAQLQQDSTTFWEVGAALDAGFDASGNPRSVANDTVVVLDVRMAPDSIDIDLIRRYRGTSLVDPTAVPVVAVAVPTVGGVGIVDTLTVPVTRRAGSHTLNVPPGDAVELATLSAPADSLVQNVWRLDVRSADTQTTFVTRGIGAPPAVLAIPSAAFRDTTQSFVVTMLVSADRRHQTASGNYTATLGVSTRITWIVAVRN